MMSMIDVHTHPVLVQETMEKDKDMERIVREVFDLQNRASPWKPSSFRWRSREATGRFCCR